MIYLFSGDDAPRKRLAYEKFLKTIPKNTEIFSIGKSDLNPAQIESLCSGPGLFFKTCAVVFSGVLESAEAREFILSKLPRMGESENCFIFLEGGLPKTTLDDFKKARAEIDVFEKEERAEGRFNSFLLANALGQKDKLGLWIYFRQAILAGVSLEELTGVLFWKAKDMLLKKNFGKLNETELKNFAGKLSYLLPEARKEGRDAEFAMEQYLLEAI